MREVRLALRFLVKKPGWTAAAVLTVAIDPLTPAVAAVVLGLAAMLAAFGPARRAARMDPATVLQAE